MKVDDLYVIIREINQINVMQASLLSSLNGLSLSQEAYQAQLEAHQGLVGVLEKYDKYNI